MTSDAKIGLLLGLVFIFVIAFIINGLPNLRPQTSKGELTTTMAPVTEENLGVADQAQKAQEKLTLNWDELLSQQEPEQTATRTTIREEPKPTTEPSQTANDRDVRSILSLPSIGAILEHLTPNFQNRNDQTNTVSMDVAKPVTEQPVVARERSPGAETPPARPTEAVTRNAGAPGAKPASPSSPLTGKVYVVSEGETLAAVAKKMYGPEEGNRIANIKRIFEANSDILKSPDQVVAGQKLLIPPPLPPLTPKPADVLSKALFEKVDAIGKQAAAKVPPKAPESRWYVVQDTDNLWKIAASQLGSGARWEEIAKLNADILKSNDALDVGMRIRLPVK
jgi:nucleoid-associated protein YgaU